MKVAIEKRQLKAVVTQAIISVLEEDVYGLTAPSGWSRGFSGHLVLASHRPGMAKKARRSSRGP